MGKKLNIPSHEGLVVL